MTTGFGSEASADADHSWVSSGAPSLPKGAEPCRAPALQRARIAPKLELSPLTAGDDFPEAAIKGHPKPAYLVTGPQGALVFGWQAGLADEELARDHLDPIAKLVNAVVGRWQQERLRSVRRSVTIAVTPCRSVQTAQ